MNFPKTFNLLRGNHESRNLTEFFTFREEVLAKFDHEVYDFIMQAFDLLPLIAVVNNQYLCMHGGISPQMKSISAVNKLNRFNEIPQEGLICDIVWSDPIDDEVADQYDFMQNPERSCSFYYGLAPTKTLLDEHDYTLIIRAH